MVLTPRQIEKLWIKAGGDPKYAPLMAAIAIAESGGNVGALNDNPSTMDYSVGLWQINYFDGLNGPRTARYGSAESLHAGDYASALANARAAVSLFAGGRGIGNWQGDAAYSAYQAHGLAGLTQFLKYNAGSGYVGGESGSMQTQNYEQGAAPSENATHMAKRAAKSTSDLPALTPSSPFEADDVWQFLANQPNASPETRMLAVNSSIYSNQNQTPAEVGMVGIPS